MPAQDAMQLKEKIISILKFKGPSIPGRIASEIQVSPLFASAFLSELLSEKRIKISNMKLGGTPIYFIPGHEYKLESFSQYLKSKEKEAFELLREKKFLADKNQEPAIRVALRSIRDFAIPFKHEEEIFWRYFTMPENEFEPERKFKPLPIQKFLAKPKLSELETDSQKLIQLQIEEDRKLIPGIVIEEKKLTPEIIPEKELNIFDNREKIEKPKKEKIEKPKIKKIAKRKTSKIKKRDDTFFNKVKEHLAKNSIELLDIENFSKNEITLRIKDKEEKLLCAFNKRKITEADIIKAGKKSSEFNLPYIVLSFGEPMKKTQNLIDALKNISQISKIE